MDEKNLELAKATANMADLELNEEPSEKETIESKMRDKQQTFR